MLTFFMKKILLPLVMVIFFWRTFAHQPRLVFQQSAGQVVNIKNPEVSQAFYGILNGQEDIYQIVSDTWFLLYVNIVVPDQEGQRTDFFVDIIKGNDAVYTRLDGSKFQRKEFYEPFGGDAYLMWPTLEKEVGSGTYIIRVSNADNQGKYSLAIGKIENFDIKEIINTYKVMPALKMQFFEKPRYLIYRSLVGAFLGGMILILILIIRWIIRLVKYLRHR